MTGSPSKEGIDLVGSYLAALDRNLNHGGATEHTHRSAFERFIEALFPGVDAVNEPRRSDCGAPDFVVAKTRPRLTIGYIEAKDVGADLRAIEKTGQIKRYLSLPNLLVTDYLGFRWYTDGVFHAAASLGEWNGKAIVPAVDGGAAAQDLLANFIQQAPQPIRSARALAVRLAVLAHHARDIIAEARSRNTSDLLRVMQSAFSATLVPDLSIPDFADMLAQTIAYGLFAARCADTSPGFSRDEATHLVPRSNPFLQRLFQLIAGTQMDDEPFIGFVEDMVDVLAHADMPSVLRDFGTHKKGEDPIVHFYETFLEAYDPAMREMRGVYYTPAPVASFMIQSVDHLLKSVFSLEAGLADGSTVAYTQSPTGTKAGRATQAAHPRVLVLDPACGTCTFFYVLITFLRDQFMARGMAGQWPDFVKTNLLPRLFGFELLMAPYAVAHLKLGMQLAALDLPEDQRSQWAYAFGRNERLNIYLTNAIEEAVERSDIMFASYISEESNAAATIKKDLPIMVVLGNPPYANFGRMNRGEWILGLLDDYKKGLHEKKLNLDDDFIKFIRFAQWRIERTGSGILAFITNSTYLDGITHRRMRASLRETFSDIYVLDLHGSVRRKEVAPDGAPDENVFDIQQGVAIGIFVKNPLANGPCAIHHAELWGARDKKYAWLDSHDLSTTKWKTLKQDREYHFFVPKDFSLRKEYEKGTKLTDIFSVFQNGIKTDRDDLFFDHDRATLADRMKVFYSDTALRPPFQGKYRILSSSSYDLLARRKETTFDPHALVQCLYRPFDLHWLYYKHRLTSRPADKVMQHLKDPGNLALLACRQQAEKGFHHAFCAQTIAECCSVSLMTREITTVFPLFLNATPPKDGKRGGGGSAGSPAMMLFEPEPQYGGRKSNIAPYVFQQLQASFGTPATPEQVFHYMYAILHSPTYRQRYSEFLKIDFPRIPLTGNYALFNRLAALGGELVALHLMVSPALAPCENPLTSPVRFPVAGDDSVDSVRYDDGKVVINARQHFTPVPEAVWHFHIGGYQVAEKWLKDRKGRSLAPHEKIHYTKIIAALGRTIELMAAIDRAVPGWPVEQPAARREGDAA